MGFAKKHSSVLIILGLSILYFTTRLFNLLTVPIFTDEAIYIRWAQIAEQDASWRFISLTDGKQPFFIWVMMLIMKIVQEPLLAGRLVSVGTGFLSMIGLFFLARELFHNKWIGVLSSFLYSIFPFALVYDRMALYDSMVGMFVVWGLYLTVLLVRRNRLDIALILGMVVGAGMLTKTNAFATLYLQPVALLLFDFSKKVRNKRLLRWLLLVLVVAIVSNALYSVLRLSPFFYIIDQKNAIFFYPLKEWLQHPFTYFFGNLSALWNWFTIYMTVPFLFLIIISFFINKKYLREKVLLLIWFMVPFIYLAFFGNNIYPRFIFFMTLPLLPLVAFALYEFKKRVKQKFLYALLFLLFIFMAVRSSSLVIADFGHAPIPRADINQYFGGWPAGQGVSETVEYLKEKSKSEKIYVGTQGTFGLMPYALELYFHDNPNIKVVSFWPIKDMPPQEVTEASRRMPTYFVFYQPCPPCRAIGQAPVGWPVDQIFQLQKQEKDSFYTLYKFQPK